MRSSPLASLRLRLSDGPLMPSFASSMRISRSSGSSVARETSRCTKARPQAAGRTLQHAHGALSSSSRVRCHAAHLRETVARRVKQSRRV
jgi:hypothetical protein